jgi:Zn finger protein HypA/HybF involved in hydrogenase expression
MLRELADKIVARELTVTKLSIVDEGVFALAVEAVAPTAEAALADAVARREQPAGGCERCGGGPLVSGGDDDVLCLACQASYKRGTANP